MQPPAETTIYLSVPYTYFSNHVSLSENIVHVFSNNSVFDACNSFVSLEQNNEKLFLASSMLFRAHTSASTRCLLVYEQHQPQKETSGVTLSFPEYSYSHHFLNHLLRDTQNKKYAQIEFLYSRSGEHLYVRTNLSPAVLTLPRTSRTLLSLPSILYPAATHESAVRTLRQNIQILKAVPSADGCVCFAILHSGSICYVLGFKILESGCKTFYKVVGFLFPQAAVLFSVDIELSLFSFPAAALESIELLLEKYKKGECVYFSVQNNILWNLCGPRCLGLLSSTLYPKDFMREICSKIGSVLLSVSTGNRSWDNLHIDSFHSLLSLRGDKISPSLFHFEFAKQDLLPATEELTYD